MVILGRGVDDLFPGDRRSRLELDEGGWYLDVVVVGRGDDLRWLGEEAMSSDEAYRPVDGAIWVTNSTILRAALRSGSRSGL